MCEQPGQMPSRVTTWPCRAPSYAVSYGGLTLVPLGPTQAGHQPLDITSCLTVRRRYWRTVIMVAEQVQWYYCWYDRWYYNWYYDDNVPW